MTQSSSWPAAPLQKSTQAFSTNSKTPPLEFDVYDASDYPNDAPVFLFFHSGGLVTGARIAVHPWLVQVSQYLGPVQYPLPRDRASYPTAIR